MWTAAIVTLLAGLALALVALTRRGRGLAVFLQICATWLWLARVSTLGLLVLFAFPLLAQGKGRALLIGAYDLDGKGWGLFGAGCVGLLLPFAIWTVFVTAALILAYGAARARLRDEPPSGFRFLPKPLLFAGLIFNLATILAATDQGDRLHVGLALGGGLLLGLAAIWGIEEVHRQLNYFPMQRYHLLPHLLAPPRRRRQPNDTGFFNDLPIDKTIRNRLRGYVSWKGDRTYLLPGHGLAILATLVFAFGVYIPLSIFLNPTGPLTALTYLLISFIFWVWLLAGATFFFDAYRIPVLCPLLAWLLLASLFAKADHFYRIWPARLTNKEQAPLTPAEVLARARAGDRKVILVAAAGGGIQSAAWTAKVLAELERVAGEGEPGRFTRSVQALSGVSGGSTGIMFFAQAYGGNGFAGPSEPARPYDRALLDRIPAAAYASSLGQITWGLAYPDLGRSFFPFYVGDPFRDRAEAMERAWAFNATSRMAAAGSSMGNASLRDWQADTRAGRRPAVIFNSTIVETGERIRFSTAPSPPDEGRCEFGAFPATGATEREAKLFLYRGADLRITTAVRLSATFPFVSPSARPALATGRDGKEMLDFEKLKPGSAQSALREMLPTATASLHLADGGYYENSGLSDLAQWLDHGLTDAGPGQRPQEVLVIQIEPFPESKAERESGQPKTPQSQPGLVRGTLFQIFSPVITLASVRGIGHTAFANYDFRLLRYRWQTDPREAVTIRHVRFVLPTLSEQEKRAEAGGSWWPAWADAKPEESPLSWHLRGPEQRAIDNAWGHLLGERQGAFLPEPTAAEWEDTSSRPIDKVLYFLSAQQPATVSVPNGTD